MLPVLLQIKSCTSRLLNFTCSPHSALIEMLNLPLQVINYQLKSSCPIKENIKTHDTCIIYNLHQTLTKLFSLLPKAVFFLLLSSHFCLIPDPPGRTVARCTGTAVHYSHLSYFMDVQGKIFHRGRRKLAVTWNHCLWITVIIVRVT